MGSVIQKRDFFIYKQILELIENCQIIETDVTGMIVKVDLEENNNLLNDITTKKFTKRLNQRRCGEKIGPRY